MDASFFWFHLAHLSCCGSYSPHNITTTTTRLVKESDLRIQRHPKSYTNLHVQELERSWGGAIQFEAARVTRPRQAARASEGSPSGKGKPNTVLQMDEKRPPISRILAGSSSRRWRTENLSSARGFSELPSAVNASRVRSANESKGQYNKRVNGHPAEETGNLAMLESW